MNRFDTYLIALLLLLTCACSRGWQQLKVDDISYGDLFRLTSHVIDSDGFVIEDANTHTGSIRTKWNYGTFADVGRFPIRRRAEAQIDPVGERTFMVHLRIKQEALWEGYGAVDLEKQKGWEAYGFDKRSTQLNLAYIRLFVEEFEPSDDFYERYKRKDLLKEKVPDILDYEQ